jgi:hypothetical protein
VRRRVQALSNVTLLEEGLLVLIDAVFSQGITSTRC